MQLAAIANLDFKMLANNLAFNHSDSKDKDKQFSALRDIIISYYTKIFR